MKHLLLALFLCTLTVAHARADVTLTVPPMEMRAPDMRLPLLNGGTFDLAERRGKVTVLNFWALWCAPCKLEMPALAELQRTLEADDIDIVAVNLADPVERVRDYVSTTQLDGLTIVMDDANAAKDWHVGALPMTYVVGPQGRIAFAALGPRAWQDAAIADALRSLKTAH